MVDFSGQVLDTFNMTKGLYEAFSKSLTDEQARQAKAAEMERASHRTNEMRNSAHELREGKSTPLSVIASLFGSEQAPQALDAMKMPIQNWNIGGSPQSGKPQGMPQQLPLPPQRQPDNQLQQYDMPRMYNAQQNNPVQGPQWLNQVRQWNLDKANLANGPQLSSGNMPYGVRGY